MKKIIYGFMLTVSIAGAHAENYCPEKLTQEQMKELAIHGQVTFKNGMTFTASDKDKSEINKALDKVGRMSKLTGKGAHKQLEEINADTSIVTCPYQFRSSSERRHGEDYKEFKISAPLSK